MMRPVRAGGSPLTLAATALCALAAVSTFAPACGALPEREAPDGPTTAGRRAPRTRLVALWWRSGKMETAQVSPPDFMDLKEQSRAFEHLAAFVPGAVDLTQPGGQRVMLRRTSVSNEFFSVLGVSPAWGRTFHPEEDRPGQDRVAILSHQLWSRQFGSDAMIVGRKISLGGEDHTVVGVMPEGFRYPRTEGLPADFEFPEATEIWTPLALEYRQMSRGLNFLKVVARLREGVTPEQAQAELDGLTSRAPKQGAPAAREWEVRVTPFAAGS